jgi:hypothetical protein
LRDALAFCLLLADIDPPRFDGAIARWTVGFVLEPEGMTADEAALPRPSGVSPKATAPISS